MKDLRAEAEVHPGGHWQVWVYPEGAQRTMAAEDFDVTIFRGIPTAVESLSTTDPFGPAEATLRFGKVTLFDRRGVGDMWWCVPEANVDIAWVVEGVVVYVWEGFIVSFDFGQEPGLGVSCQGALHQLDHYMAKPEYPYAPFSFEHAIARQFRDRPSLRVAQMIMKWPSWWDRVYQPDPKLVSRSWMQPRGVTPGQFWSGMVTRHTGSWEVVLTSYIQTLLQSMQTERGQFTMLLDPGRVPILKHRDRLADPDGTTLLVDLLWPGVDLTISEDHSQKLNTVFMSGRSISGVAYSGMNMSNDGQTTYYEPYASRRQVHPETDNPWLERSLMRREVQLRAADGMASDDAMVQARSHLQRFADPGLTGTLTLNTDPQWSNGDLYPRQTLQAGQSLIIRSLFSEPEGIMFHVTESSVSQDGAVSLTIDSKFRDQLTVQEVMLRGRDALTPQKLLTTGSWQPNMPDMLFPWSYDLGAGYIPFGSNQEFRREATNEKFPWPKWSKAHPPKDPRWKDSYIRIGPKNANADYNWSTVYMKDSGDLDPIMDVQYPILLSQAGQAKLIQIAAYDKDGNVMPVSFHFSIYMSNSLDSTVGPVINEQWVVDETGYGMFQHYPFWRGAWEVMDDNGISQTPTETPQAESSANIIIGWGNHYERCGYWPGQSSDQNDKPTGLFVNEEGFQWDLTEDETGVNPQEDAATNTAELSRAMVYCLVYCDDQGDQEVFFRGRIFRTETGAV